MTEARAAHAAPANPVLAELWRGPVLECAHRGTVVVAGSEGEIVEAWGDPARVLLPRSSCKMLQALPLVESGAADAAALGADRLALACASHTGAEAHTGRVRAWLADLGLGEDALRCGAHAPSDPEGAEALRAAGARAGPAHNNCSGKHAGFLTLARHLGADPEGYLDTGHPVQRAVRAAIEETCGEETRGQATDGCSAPNFAVTAGGLARAMARMARPEAALGGARGAAARRLVAAMAAHPALVAGEGRACTRLIRAARGRAVVKTGAEGVYVGILPEAGLGIALKIDDGAGRGAEAAIAALLARHGALEARDPAVAALADAPLVNWRGIECGRLRAARELMPA
jgi:L-asparaginase II